MKFKNTKKSDTTKEPSSAVTKSDKEALLKDEIREIVEETVEDVLKEKEVKIASPVTHSVDEEKNEAPMVVPADVEDKNPVDELASNGVSAITENKDTSADPTGFPAAMPTPVEIHTTATPSQPVVESSEKSASPISPVTAITPSDTMSESSDMSEVTTRKSRLPLLILILIFLLLLLGGGYYYLMDNHMLPSGIPSFSAIQKKEVTPTKKVEATATPKPVDLSKYEISVLNGSGISGEAAKVKTTLTEAGFKVTNTGNADASDVTDTYLSAKSTVDEAYITKLSEMLGKTYKVSSEIKKLDATAVTDVTVTIGVTTK